MFNKRQFFVLGLMLVGLIIFGSALPTALALQAAKTATPQATEMATENATPEVAPSLPGANGQPVEYLLTPAKDTIVRNVFVASDEHIAITKIQTTDGPIIFTSGITKLYLIVQMFTPDHDVNIVVKVVNDKGLVALKPQDFNFWMNIPDLNLTNAAFDLFPVSGKFDDGPYQATLIVDGKKVALLNWQVGQPIGTESTPVATAEATPEATAQQ